MMKIYFCPRPESLELCSTIISKINRKRLSLIAMSVWLLNNNQTTSNISMKNMQHSLSVLYVVFLIFYVTNYNYIYYNTYQAFYFIFYHIYNLHSLNVLFYYECYK